MKKLLLIVFSLLVFLLILGGVAVKFIYDGVDSSRVPAVSATVFGTELSPGSYHWQASVFGGLTYKEFSSEGKNATTDIGEITGADAALILPEGYTAIYELFYEGSYISTGGIEEFCDDLYADDPGAYVLSIYLSKPAEGRGDHGFFTFSLRFEVPYPEPSFLTGNTTLYQGEVFVVRLSDVAPNVMPTAVTELGMSIFTRRNDGEWLCAIPVGNTRTAGSYRVSVSAGEYAWEADVTVKAYGFDTQNLIIDTSNPVISEANSQEAYAQYREKIPPLYDTYDSAIYWEGTFIRPVLGRTSTKFGVIRYTNSNWSNPRHHWGMDIAADEGTPVWAPNNGRVVFAEYLLNTGYTAVIEHGGGLKSYYYHMYSLDVGVGDIVQKGMQIGLVGSTGYSTGPHLHFEMRIGNQAINPSMLFEDSASLYSL